LQGRGSRRSCRHAELVRLSDRSVADELHEQHTRRAALRELGYEAVEADTAAMARQKLAENPRVTILLTDVVLPIENGRELANSLIKDRPDLVVLYMTGYTRNSIVHNGTLDPGVRLLSKPFTVDDLKRELRAALAQRTVSALTET